MIRPANFGFNAETAENNAFQSDDSDLKPSKIAELAVKEFDGFVKMLEDNNVEVVVVEDTQKPLKTDAVFPNNWVSFHRNSAVITYPMQSLVRRLERRDDILSLLIEKYGFKRRYSLEHYEEKSQYLEGTGSMMLDRENQIVYACLSIRTDPKILDKFCALTEYRRLVFVAQDKKDIPVYHTNVMMSIGESFAVICLEAIRNPAERKRVVDSLMETQKEIIEITLDQMHSFAGNMLQVCNHYGDRLLIMSAQARKSLDPGQLTDLEKHGKILAAPLDTIEHFGGGSARCMMAEVFTPLEGARY